MIELYDGEISSLLNNSMKYNPETIATGYAILCEKRRILELTKATRLMSAIEDVDENILDCLAVEMRTPAYKDSLPLSTKHSLVAGTLMFYAKLGTPAAVEWVIRSFFDSGRLLEWFEYGGSPNRFQIVLDGQPLADHKEEFLSAVELVKRKDQWLDKIIVLLKAIAHAPMAFVSHRVDFHVGTDVFGVQIIRLDGTRRLDGSWALGTEWARGAKFPKMSLRWGTGRIMRLHKIVSTRSRSFYLPGIRTRDGLRAGEEAAPSHAYRMAISAGAEAGASLSGELTADSMWRLDGSYRLDGSRRLNADIITTKL